MTISDMIAKHAKAKFRRDLERSILFYRGTPDELRREVATRMEELGADIDAEFPVGMGGLEYRRQQGWTIAARPDTLAAISSAISPRVIANLIRGPHGSLADSRMFRMTCDDFIRCVDNQFDSIQRGDIEFLLGVST